MAPWLRAPFLLARRPGVAAALVAAAFVAALPAAAAAPFLSSAANATLHTQMDRTCPAIVADKITYDMRIYSDDDFQSYFGTTLVRSESVATTMEIERRLDVIAARGSGLAPPNVYWMATSAQLKDGSATDRVTLMSTPDFKNQVSVVSGPSGDGIWVPDQYAEVAHLKVGDRMVFISPFGDDTTVRVAAIYRSLRKAPITPYFCGFSELINGGPGAALSNDPIPPLLLMDRQTFLTGNLPYRARAILAYQMAQAHPPADRTGATIATIKKLNAAVVAPENMCRDCNFIPVTESQLTALSARAALARAGIKPAAVPITIAGVVVGLIVVGAAAVFWVVRRRRELVILSAHGMGAVSVSIKAVLEALPALVIGTVLAWFGAWWLVRTVGPDPLVAHSAFVDSLRAAGATFVGAVIVVAIAAGLRSRTLTDEAHVKHRFRPAAWPWELLIIAGAAYAWNKLGSSTVIRTTPGSDGGQVVHVPTSLLVVPLLIIVGVVVLVARVGTHVVRRRAGRRGRSSMVWYLGWRRIVREALIVAVLAAATAMPIGLATYGETVTGSVQTTIDGESHLIVGADAVATLSKPVPVPASLAGQATEVLSLRSVKFNGVAVNLYAVDPASFARVAFWNDQISGSSLADLLAPLRAPHQPGTPWPAVTSESLVPNGDNKPEWGQETDTVYDVTVTGTLPGEHAGFDAIIVPKESLGSEADVATPQLWIKGDPAETLPKLQAAGLPVTYVATAAGVFPGTVFQPLTYTFEYLTALSILTGVVTVVGLMLYIEARSPGHRRGYVMARRMGLSPGTHRRALLLELAVPLIVGLAIGVALAVALAYGFSRGFDIDPQSPPQTLLTLPGTAIGGICVAVAVVALVAAFFAQFRVGRANPSEVLRDTI